MKKTIFAFILIILVFLTACSDITTGDSSVTEYPVGTTGQIEEGSESGESVSAEVASGEYLELTHTLDTDEPFVTAGYYEGNTLYAYDEYVGRQGYSNRVVTCNTPIDYGNTAYCIEALLFSDGNSGIVRVADNAARAVKYDDEGNELVSEINYSAPFIGGDFFTPSNANESFFSYSSDYDRFEILLRDTNSSRPERIAVNQYDMETLHTVNPDNFTSSTDYDILSACFLSGGKSAQLYATSSLGLWARVLPMNNASASSEFQVCTFTGINYFSLHAFPVYGGFAAVYMNEGAAQYRLLEYDSVSNSLSQQCLSDIVSVSFINGAQLESGNVALVHAYDDSASLTYTLEIINGLTGINIHGSSTVEIASAPTGTGADPVVLPLDGGSVGIIYKSGENLIFCIYDENLNELQGPKVLYSDSQGTILDFSADTRGGKIILAASYDLGASAPVHYMVLSPPSLRTEIVDAATVRLYNETAESLNLYLGAE